ncbi:small heat shock protein [Panaeolus papilionaceus]|nr:small heat shock protein [Panaeolus papilionaceus]
MSNICFYEPFDSFDRFLDEALSLTQPLEAIKGQVARPRLSEGVVTAIKPRMDLHEDDEKHLVTATFEFPGVAKDAIRIDVQNGRLTVWQWETRQSEEHTENGYAVRERLFGKVSRTLQLPQGINDDEIKAAMENGVLITTFPKSAPQLAPKKISIS